MVDFVKRNLVWVSIFLCVTGIVLSIIGIPTKQPICFFVGIILALPTIAYLVYQVFFDNGEAEINLKATTNQITTGNVTTILENKKEELVLMNYEPETPKVDDETIEDEFEQFYDGYASPEEIELHLEELTKVERAKAIETTPVEIIPVIEEQPAFETTVKPVIDEEAINVVAQDELLRQREEVQPQEQTPTPIQELEQPASSYQVTSEPSMEAGPSLQPESISTEAVSQEPTAQMLAESPGTVVIKINTANGEIKKQRAQEKKMLLQQTNLEKYLQRYFIETASCFLLDRNIYKDNCGIAPYNKFAVNKVTNLPEYTMSATKGRLYKFCTYLLDAERFITHPTLYNDFIIAVEKGVSLARISETLHPLYRRKYKKDFILNLNNREDWDNVIILVYNNYLLNNDNFKDVFTRVPFEIPVAYNDQNITDYLNDVDIQDRFAEKYPAIAEMGFPTIWEALFICFVNSVKQKLNIEQIESAILKDYKKIARSLKRTDNARHKVKKAS